MSEKVSCKGGCGKEKSYAQVGAGGYDVCRGDKIVEWVCDGCWKQGVRTASFKDLKSNG